MKTPYTLFGVETPDGWESLVRPLLEEANKRHIRIAQVKEKFGGLRFYHDGHADKAFSDMVQEAEDRSYATCTVCGKPGKLYGGGWILPFCEEHAKANGRTREVER